jgi:hypothetical protein
MKGLATGLGKNEKTSSDVKAWLKEVKITSEPEAQAALSDLTKFYSSL